MKFIPATILAFLLSGCAFNGPVNNDYTDYDGSMMFDPFHQLDSSDEPRGAADE
ncbi:hypothetical protein [Spongorhabdus nitratireducens]